MRLKIMSCFQLFCHSDYCCCHSNYCYHIQNKQVMPFPTYPTSYIRHKDFRPSPSVRNTQRTPPPCILKRGELESSGQRLISSIGKTKRIAYFLLAKKAFFKNFTIFFLLFFLRIGLAWTPLVRNKIFFYYYSLRFFLEYFKIEKKNNIIF